MSVVNLNKKILAQVRSYLQLRYCSSISKLSNKMVFSMPIAFVISFFLLSNVHAQSPQGLTLQGTILNASDLPQEGASVSFVIQILSSDGNACLLYEESHVLNMTGSQGAFSLILGTGTRSGVNYEDTNTLALAMDNTLGVQSSLTCAVGSTYDPAPGDSRDVLISFNDGSGVQTLTQNLLVQSVPYAFYTDNTERLQGKLATDFIQVNTATASLSQVNIENVFSTTNYPNLVDLLSVSPTEYVRTGSNGSASIPQITGNPGSGLAAGQIWYDDAANLVKYYDGTMVQSLSGSGSGDLVSTNNLSDISNAATARTNLGLAIGTNVQAFDAQLTDVAGLDPSTTSGYLLGSDGTNLVMRSPANARSDLGLGTAATSSTGDFLQVTNNLSDISNAGTARTNLGLAIGTNVQAFDAQLTDVAGLTPTADNFVSGDGTNLVMKTPAQARTSLGLGTAATSASGDFLQVTNNLSDIGSAATARTNLGLGTAALLSEDSNNTFANGQLVAFDSATMTCAAGEYLTIQGPGPTYSYTCGTPSATDSTKLPLAGGTMTGPLVNNSNSASTALAITQSGAGHAATFMGGNVGIGTTTPSYPLSVIGNTNVLGTLSATSITSSNLSTFNGGVIATLTSSTFPYSGTSASISNAGTRKVMQMSMSPNPTADYTTNYYNGDFLTVASTANNQNSGKYVTINSASTHTGTGTVLDMTGGDFSITNSTGTITDGFGLKTSITNSATVTNAYGLYVGNIQGTNRYSIYSSDSNAPSFFAGNMGIGVSSPARLLNVAGPIRVNPAALPGTPGAGDIAIDSGASNALKYYNGSSWVTVGSGSGDLVSTNNLSDLSNAGTARTNLGLAIGTNVQAFDAQLTDVAGLTPTADNFVSGDGTNLVMKTPAQARTSLGLGTAATNATGDFLQVTNNLSDLGSATTARTNLGLGTAALLSEDSNNTFANGQLVAFDSATMTCVAGEYLTIQGRDILKCCGLVIQRQPFRFFYLLQ
ncbi:MAG: hypothetical protein H6625_11165 [Bdellovibrionaceae bacterium]|nr:hypothetical protein [Pseudobdellovibrionaceae bacterium]